MEWWKHCDDAGEDHRNRVQGPVGGLKETGECLLGEKRGEPSSTERKFG